MHMGRHVMDHDRTPWFEICSYRSLWSLLVHSTLEVWFNYGMSQTPTLHVLARWGPIWDLGSAAAVTPDPRGSTFFFPES